MCIPEAYNELRAISNLHMRKIEWSVVRDVSVVACGVRCIWGVWRVRGECAVYVVCEVSVCRAWGV